MSMSRKDYEAVAAIFRDERASLSHYRETAQPALPRAGVIKADSMQLQIDRLEEALCILYKQDNPRFDPVRFRKAAQP